MGLRDPFGPWGLDNAYLDWLVERNPDLVLALREKLSAVGNIPVESHMTTWAAERTIDYLSRRGPGKISKPFFCCMSVFDPHSPYVNHPKEMEDLLDIPNLPAIIAGKQPFEGRPIAHEMEHKWGPQIPDPETLAQWRIGYHAGITNIDLQVGRVLEALESQGMDENTVVIFTSDHGDMMGDHGLMTKGAYFYDACTRVPMIVRNPGAEPSAETAPVQWHDIAGTCLQIAGQSAVEINEWSPDGISILDSPALKRRNRAVCLYRNSGVCNKREAGYRGYFDPPIHGTMWFEDDYKVNVYHSPPPDNAHPQGEIYNIAEDPDEMVNLWDSADMRELRSRTVLKAMDWLTRETNAGRARGIDAPRDRFTV